MTPVSNTSERRQCIPVIYTKGTHYEVGLDVGKTFGSLIRSFVESASFLNDDYIPLYNTPGGEDTYNATLESVKQSFPQYIRELEGIADGSQVEFYKLFLLHMDDILPRVVEQRSSIDQPIGCTSICVNRPDCEVIGHTEDALTCTLNHFYIVSAHIISESPQGKHNVVEEKFTSLCYAGHLPGYTMGFNHHGLIATINTLSAKQLRSGKTPRHFISRALLSAENFEQAHDILRDSGVGAADGCSFNITFLSQPGERYMYNAEMGPADPDQMDSKLHILTVNRNEYSFHANRYLRLKIPEVCGLIVDSSVDRKETFDKLGEPKTKADVIALLGDTSHKRNKLFRGENKCDEYVKTIAVGVFDCQRRTWELYADNPKLHPPMVTLPIILKDE